METVIKWIGTAVFWVGGITGALALTGYFLILLLNVLSKYYDVMWRMVEYNWHRLEFKEWVKEKERHPMVKVETEVVCMGDYVFGSKYSDEAPTDPGVLGTC